MSSRINDYHKKATELNKENLSEVGIIDSTVGLVLGFSFIDGNADYKIFVYDGDILEEKDNELESVRELGLYELK